MPMTQLLFSFQGRLNRKPYWMTAIATMVIIIVLLLLALILIREHRFEFAGLTLTLLVILYIPLIWIGLAISVWAFVELGCLRGTPGPNRYGPDPLDTPA